MQLVGQVELQRRVSARHEAEQEADEDRRVDGAVSDQSPDVADEMPAWRAGSRMWPGRKRASKPNKAINKLTHRRHEQGFFRAR
jgi:hypothetical protein